MNFAVVSGSATSVKLVLFTEQDLAEGRSTLEVELDRDNNRTGDVWHVMLPMLDSSLLYGESGAVWARSWRARPRQAAAAATRTAERFCAPWPWPAAAYRVAGPNQAKHNDFKGHRYDNVSLQRAIRSMEDRAGGAGPHPHRCFLPAPRACPCPLTHVQSVVVLDPYARAVIGRRQYGVLGPELEYASPDVLGYAGTWPQAACALPTADEDEEFDWEGDTPLNIPMEQLVIYEMGVRAFTQHETSGVQAPGERGARGPGSGGEPGRRDRGASSSLGLGRRA